MDKEQAEQLIRRYLDGRCSPEERRLVEWWYLKLTEDASPDAASKDIDTTRLKKEVWKAVRKRSWSNRPWIAAVAAVLLAVMTSVFYLYLPMPLQKNNRAAVQRENTTIHPGGNRAKLTLVDGTQLDLDERQEGIVIGRELTYLDGSPVSSLNSVNPQPRMIETPKGGQYRVILPDGTAVWLNAATTLRFDTQPNSNERVVSLTGEAYFDVNNGYGEGRAKSVFTVKTEQQQVTVLGTGFNVSAYGEGAQTVTTLVNGRVKVMDTRRGGNRQDGESYLLEPGFQAITTTDDTYVSAANLESATGWKNGDFVFDGSSIREIMQQLSRWYDVNVVYHGAVTTEAFGGKISRKKNIEEVLRVLELTGGVTFKIENKTIIINP